jgi:hypothetical protein
MPTCTISYHEGDTLPLITPTLMEGATPADLTGATSVLFALYEKGGEGGSPVEEVYGTIVDAANGIVEFTPTATLFAEAGRYSAVVRVLWGAGGWETLPDPGYIDVVVRRRGDKNALGAATIASTSAVTASGTP